MIFVSSFSLQGLFRLEQKFDPNWFIPNRTYLSKYLHKQSELYPDIGYEATIFVGNVNYSRELPKIMEALDRIENKTQLVKDISTWTQPFRDFVLVYFNKGDRRCVLIKINSIVFNEIVFQI